MASLSRANLAAVAHQHLQQRRAPPGGGALGGRDGGDEAREGELAAHHGPVDPGHGELLAGVTIELTATMALLMRIIGGQMELGWFDSWAGAARLVQLGWFDSWAGSTRRE